MANEMTAGGSYEGGGGRILPPLPASRCQKGNFEEWLGKGTKGKGKIKEQPAEIYWHFPEVIDANIITIK